ncbi:ankyrin repeat protein [Seminavis robusta]|uniref:Ankyrin repeat protein n=1 Tax=Seminavis robusta TaxID=568900 RepID=A0A9N8HBP9_9STRA|nr:ankyrin repeat protein [Seminavis robusta]|eukprot:Sro269_g103910.1 ankyrin repeat protein (359) ;mRNA; f:11376-12452
MSTTNPCSPNKMQKLNPAILDQKELWISHILQFLGMGQYAYVGAVNKKFNHLYKEYCDSVKNPPTVKLGKKKRAAISTDTFYSVVFYNVPCTRYWHVAHNSSQNLSCFHQNDVCPTIAKAGNLPVLQWASIEEEYPMEERTCSAAAGGGHLELLKWAQQNGCPWDKATCSAAACGGHLELLKWARENGCPWDEETCWYAARHGHLELLKWARQHGCPWNEETCSSAARGGHLELLKWARENGCRTFGTSEMARENGCPWNGWTRNAAAGRGHLELLKWAHENGCPWDTETCYAAAGGGHLELLKWAHENGCPWDKQHALLLLVEAFGTSEMARENGCPWMNGHALRCWGGHLDSEMGS